jgi:hypothetical protein
MGFKPNSILRKPYTNEGESDQAENTIKTAMIHNQEVLKDLNTNFGTLVPWDP